MNALMGVNLMVNAILSFAAGAALAWALIRLFRVGHGSFRLYLLGLPFFKILFDLGGGIPRDSILWTGQDPWSLLSLSSGRLWLGLNDYGPYAGINMKVAGTTGANYSVSVGDLVASWLQRTAGAKGTLIILGLVGAVSLGRIARRVLGTAAFELQRRRRRRLATMLRSEPTSFWRTIDVYLSPLDSGSPFAGGLSKPYICFPAEAYDKLTAEEQQAALDHEIAHVRNWDLPQMLFLALLGDVFWFVPGYSALKVALDELREVLADQAAVRSGADSLALASALLKFQHGLIAPSGSGACSALVKKGSLLRRRVEALLDDGAAQNHREALANRLLLGVGATVLVCMTSCGGNKTVSRDVSLTGVLVEELQRSTGWYLLPF